MTAWIPSISKWVCIETGTFFIGYPLYILNKKFSIFCLPLTSQKKEFRAKKGPMLRNSFRRYCLENATVLLSSPLTCSRPGRYSGSGDRRIIRSVGGIEEKPKSPQISPFPVENGKRSWLRRSGSFSRRIARSKGQRSLATCSLPWSILPAGWI